MKCLPDERTEYTQLGELARANALLFGRVVFIIMVFFFTLFRVRFPMLSHGGGVLFSLSLSFYYVLL